MPERVPSKIKMHNRNYHRAYFGPGNNSELVRSIVLGRKGWIETIERLFSLTYR